MAHKTKAAMPGRQCYYTKLVRTQNNTLIDQVNRRYFCSCAGGKFFPDVHSPKYLGQYAKVTASDESTGCGKWEPKSHLAKPVVTAPTGNVVQPFGSMPRCCSSLRSMRLIQVARDESPSFRISSSSCERNSSLNRIWYCGDFFSSCIDTCNYPSYHLNVTTRVITFELKSNAPECGNTTEASHQTVIRGNDHG